MKMEVDSEDEGGQRWTVKMEVDSEDGGGQ